MASGRAAHSSFPELGESAIDKLIDTLIWVDTPADRTWSHPDLGDLMRTMDRFHRIPPTPEFAALMAGRGQVDVGHLAADAARPTH